MGRGSPNDLHQSQISKKRAKSESGCAKIDNILRKDNVPTCAKKECKLCSEYGDKSNSHSILNCKKWLPGGKPHPGWMGGKATATIKVQRDDTVNRLMAQQAEFQKTILKQMSKMYEKTGKQAQTALF